jgi:sugar fermentation stimulation protein A
LPVKYLVPEVPQAFLAAPTGSRRADDVLVPFEAPLRRARFLRRYKRFFVDVAFDDGTQVTAHTANTGSMSGLLVQDAPVLLSLQASQKRAYPWELEAIRPASSWVACNTIRANRVARAFVAAGLVDGLVPTAGPLTTEVSLKEGCRIDLALGSLLIEVKSVTLCEGRRGLFPDAVSVRAQKHLRALIEHARNHKAPSAALLFLVQRDDVDDVAAASAVDPTYATLLDQAASAGVLLRAARVIVDEVHAGLRFGGLVPVRP